MATFTYQGQRYNLPDGTSPEDAKAKILQYLETQKPQDSSGSEEEDSIFDPVLAQFREEGVLNEIGEGMVGGVIEAGSGLLELGALVPDLVTGSDYSRRISQSKDELKEYLGVDPTGTAGELTEVITQFVIPGLGAAGLASKAARAYNFSKNANRASQVVAAGVVDGMVASDGTTTIGDFFGGGPTMTSQDIGQGGHENAKRQLGNRLKFVAEAAGATAAVEPAFKILGLAGQGTVAAARITDDVVGFSRLAAATGESVGSSVAKIIEKDDVFGRFTDKTLGLLRSRGMLPQGAFETRSRLTGKIEQQLNRSGRIIRSLERKLDKVIGTENQTFRNLMTNGDANTKVEAINILYGFLAREPGFLEAAKREAAHLGIRNFDPTKTTDLVKVLPDFMQREALAMRGQIELLTKQIANSDLITKGMIPDVENIINEQLGSYMSRKFAAFEDPDWFKTDAFKQSYENAIKFYEENPEMAEKFARQLNLPEDETMFTGIGVNRRTTRGAATSLVDNFVSRYDGPSTLTSMGSGQVGRVVKDKLRTSLFTQKKIETPALRALLGEIKDPMESFVSTVSDLAEFKAIDDFYDDLFKNHLDSGPNSTFISKEAYEQLPDVLPNGQRKTEAYKQLSTGTEGVKDISYGAMQGTYAKEGAYQALTRKTVPRGTTEDTLNRMILGNFLRGKGLVQFSKTVLSPITQIRNVTSAGMFALAQGNVGRGANLGESIALTIDNIYKGEIPRLAKMLGVTEDEAKGIYFRKLQDLGVVGTQAQVREIDKLLEEGVGVSIKSEVDSFGVNVSQGKGLVRRTLGKSGLGQFLDSAIIERGKRITSRARDYYQGGDDIWKIYNYQFERNKIISALGDEFNANAYARDMGFADLDEYAADIVKNVVPNYERVPEAIRLLRRVPFGNFIAFPAEIIRTSANTLGVAVKELQSSNPKVRNIGMRRLIGFTSTAAVSGPAIQMAAMGLSGVAQDSMDALQRRVADWSRNSTLIPTSTKKVKIDGVTKIVPTAYIDYSFTNPYDFLNRPVRAIINAVDDGTLLDLNPSEVAVNAAAGAFGELLSPFAEPSILTKKIADVTINKGKPPGESPVYDLGSGDFKNDTASEATLKSIVHIAEAFMPGIVEQTVGKIAKDPELGGNIGYVPSRLVEAITSQNGKDARGNERKMAEEILRLASGVTETKIKAEDMAKYGSYQYTDTVSSIGQVFNRATRVKNGMDPENIKNIYREVNEKLFREQNRMYGLVKDMKALGFNEIEIRKALKENGVGDATRLIKGEFSPKVISPEIVSDARKTTRDYGGEFPIQELNAIRKSLLRRPLTGKPLEIDDEDQSDLDLLSSVETQSEPTLPIAATANPPAVAQVGTAASPSAVPVPIQQITAQPPTDLALMGGDPRTVQLAQRMQQRGIS